MSTVSARPAPRAGANRHARFASAVLAALVAVLAAPGRTARADDPAPQARSPRASTAQYGTALVADGAFGGSGGWYEGGGVAGDLSINLRVGSLLFGGVLGGETTSAGIGAGVTNSYRGAALGFRRVLASRIDLELMAEGGRHEATLTPGLFASGEGRAFLPYLGARAALEFHVGGPVRLRAAPFAAFRTDLARRHVVVPVSSTPLFFGPSVTELRDYGAVGGASLMFGLRLGMELGLVRS